MSESRFPEKIAFFAGMPAVSDVKNISDEQIDAIISEYSPNSEDIDCAIQNMVSTIESLRAEIVMHQENFTIERGLRMKGLGRIDLLEDHNKRLLETLKLCHRKHGQHDDSIGWDELVSDMGYTLAEVMGDDKFQEWLEE